MAINKAMRIALKALSYPDLDVKKNYKLHRQMTNVAHPYIKPKYEMWDHKVSVGDYDIPVRVFFPPESDADNRVLVFFHGGGWVIGNIDSYTTVCSNMANMTGHIVVSVDYRLAPEYKFPTAPEDCYAVTKAIFENADTFGVEKKNITLIGDSAGGNLAAVVSIMARDRGEFMPSRQILLYPSTDSDHSQTSPYESVRENGTDFLLTTKRICDFIDLYKSSDEDLSNPYLAPILSKDLSNQPRTLIITAQYDPLRDEGEAYGKKLYAFGNEAEVYRMKDALHGFISLPKHFVHVKRSYELINQFLNNESSN
ncbi:alpha/beta hydrolase [Lachnospiraceae bacterium MD1]|uniref:Alpha/beta hydrolase n=1 Tax=Variimorphobacter saccharofermentans TaxID=2755051 RepID=A0A839JZ70_9FIRM|nr:alpha/beta hydrolase [Variimorphobacter saccharofermentans]MBB2182272.1 alpha/beta hydrolase [Variimorphobacter saccharofermentans]